MVSQWRAVRTTFLIDEPAWFSIQRSCLRHYRPASA